MIEYENICSFYLINHRYIKDVMLRMLINKV